jgi:hypothetical protein
VFQAFSDMLQVYVSIVLIVSDVCFPYGCCKVDRDVTYVAVVARVCCKRLFPMFHLFFSGVCCKCVYLDVAYMFRTYVASILSECCVCFRCFSFFRRMLQVFQLFLTYVACVSSDVAKVDRDVACITSRHGERAQVEAVPRPQAVPTCVQEARWARTAPMERRRQADGRAVYGAGKRAERASVCSSKRQEYRRIYTSNKANSH